jgi:hypothetical protein
MSINTLDGIEVEVTFCDAGYAPGTKPTQLLNVRACWFRPKGGAWHRSKHRSAAQTSFDIKHTKAEDLHLISDRKSITDTKESNEQKQAEPKVSS